MYTTDDVRNDPRSVLGVLLSGIEGGGPLFAEALWSNPPRCGGQQRKVRQGEWQTLVLHSGCHRAVVDRVEGKEFYAC